MMSKTKYLLVALIVISTSLIAATKASKNIERKTNKPNIILILADDQGWNALSALSDPAISGSGSTYFQTPCLAKFAKEGIRFSQAYSPAPTCSPTRWAIQFGRSPSSLKIWGADGINKKYS